MLADGGDPDTVYYISTDHLNTPRLVADQNGVARWRWGNQEPFGDPVQNAPNENPAGAGAFVFNLRFPGQYFDKETNLHYNYFRDYDPAIGRYIQSDQIGLQGGINTYAYVGGNPLSRTDPQGLIAIPQAPTPSIPSTSTLVPSPLPSGSSAPGTQICVTGLFELCKNSGFITSALSPMKLCTYDCPSGKTHPGIWVHKIQPCPRVLPGF